MVAEVELQPPKGIARADERLDPGPGVAQRLDVGGRQAVAADGVVDEEHAHAPRAAVGQRRVQRAADAVVVHDVELEQHVVARLRDGLEDCREGRLAVDQQARIVAADEGHQREALERRERQHVLGQLRAQHRRELALDAPREGADVGVAGAPRKPVAAELAPAEHRVERQGDPGEGHQRDRPGHRALRRARRHHCTQRRRDRDQLDDDEDRRVEREGFAVDHPSSPARPMRGGCAAILPPGLSAQIR